MTSKHVRCAVYTRKSSEEGLEQSFNSLDAQREACEAYIKSQAHEGWKLVPTIYDDGGYSGGSLDRPAIKGVRSLKDKSPVERHPNPTEPFAALVLPPPTVAKLPSARFPQERVDWPVGGS